MEVLGTVWLNAGRVGVVRVKDPYDGIKYYVAAIYNGSSEDADIKYIKEWGNTFPTDAGDVLFGIKHV